MNIFRLFLIAVEFLTCLPVRLRKKPGHEELGRSIAFFPLVGLLLGCLMIGLEYLLAFFLPGSVVKLILLGALIMLTGGLHLDGLADTVDALASRKDRGEMLRIMKESAIGPMGVAAIIGVLALKYIILCNFFGPRLYFLLLFFPMIGRMAMVCACWQFPYARGEGTGKIFIVKGERSSKKEFIVAGAISLVVSFLLFNVRGIIILGTVILLTIFTGRYFSGKFGGITGDNLGFINEIGEIVALVGVTIVL